MNITDYPTPETDAKEFPVFHRASFIEHARNLEQRLACARAALDFEDLIESNHTDGITPRMMRIREALAETASKP